MTNRGLPPITERSGISRERRATVLVVAAVILATLIQPGRNSHAGESPDSLAQLDALAWMAGCWGAAEGAESADECWLERRGNVMMGFHIDVFENGQVFFEYLRIVAADDTVDYLASPMGSSPTPFTLVETDEQRAVFENPRHDWPQRLTYWREGDRLHARAEGLDESSREANWVWQLREGS